MTSRELSFLFKYMFIMFIPVGLVFYLIELLFSAIFDKYIPSNFEEIVLKVITIIWIITIVRFWTKSKKILSNELINHTPIILTVNTLRFIIYSTFLFFLVKVIFNAIGGRELLIFDSLLDILINELLLIIVLIVNLTKRIKFLNENPIETAASKER